MRLVASAAAATASRGQVAACTVQPLGREFAARWQLRPQHGPQQQQQPRWQQVAEGKHLSLPAAGERHTAVQGDSGLALAVLAAAARMQRCLTSAPHQHVSREHRGCLLHRGLSHEGAAAAVPWMRHQGLLPSRAGLRAFPTASLAFSTLQQQPQQQQQRQQGQGDGTAADLVYNVPNAVSMARLVSGPVIAYWMLQGQTELATVALLVSGVSSCAGAQATPSSPPLALDVYESRRTHQVHSRRAMPWTTGSGHALPALAPVCFVPPCRRATG